MTTERVESIPLAALVASPTQPRTHMADAALQDLADSIRQIGVQQPIVVRPSSTEWHGGVRAWEIVFGHRRARAAELAELDMIPAIPRVMTDEQVALAQLAENLQREDMSALDEADAVVRLRHDLRMDPDRIARELGKSRSWVYGRLKLAGLDPRVRLAMAGEGVAAPLPADIALEIARLPVAATQRAALKRVEDYSGHWVSVREAQRLVRRMAVQQEIRIEHFDPAAADLVPAAGPCTACPKRAGNDPDLLDAGTPEQACTDSDCYTDKRRSASHTKLHALAAAGRRVASTEETAKIFAAPLRAGGWVHVDSTLNTRLAEALEGLGDEGPQPLHAVDPDTGALLRLLSEDEAERVVRLWQSRQARARGETVRRGSDGPAPHDDDADPDDDEPDPTADWTPAERASLDARHWDGVRAQVLQRAACAERTLAELRLVLRQQLAIHDGEPWAPLMPALRALGIEHECTDPDSGPGGDWWAAQIPHMTGAQLAAVLVLETLDDALAIRPWTRPYRGATADHWTSARADAARRLELARCYGVEPSTAAPARFQEPAAA